jgi:hypothetical protein
MLRTRKSNLGCKFSHCVSKERNNIEARSAWCAIDVKGSTIRAKVNHISAGKFRIIDDKEGGKYIGTIVDASDIIHCT